MPSKSSASPERTSTPRKRARSNPAAAADAAPVDPPPAARRSPRKPPVEAQAEPPAAAAEPSAKQLKRRTVPKPAAADAAVGKPARKPRAPRKAAPAAAEVPASPPAATLRPTIDVRSVDAGDGIARLAVTGVGEEAAQVEWRGSADSLCDCLDFSLAEDGLCPHLIALTEAQAPALPAPGFSRIALRRGALARPVWLPGAACPAVLADAAAALQHADLDAAALGRLLRQSRETGHELRVDEAVWRWLAERQAAAGRVQRLEQLWPDGPACAERSQLGAGELLPVQAEAALFALCAGRSMLADDEVLEPRRQALAAALLGRRHFGVERVLLLAPIERLPQWRGLLGADAAGWNLTALESVAGDVELHRSLTADLVIVDEGETGGLWTDAERAAALLRLDAELAIVLPARDWASTPSDWPLRLAFVDRHRLGPYAALLRHHGLRDAAGELIGLQRLDELRETLAPVLLARRLDEVRARLPERIDIERRVAIDPSDRHELAGQAGSLAAEVERWRAIGWIDAAAQRRLVAGLQALRRRLAGDGAPGVARAKADAVRAVLAGDGEPVAKLVVFAQWPGALDALQRHLLAWGIAAQCWSSSDEAAVRDAVRVRFCSDPAMRVLLVADAGLAALEPPTVGAQVLHLDRPWQPRQLVRRFGRVHRRGSACLVKVTHLLVAGSLEQALAAGAGNADAERAGAELLDAQPAEGLIAADVASAWLDELATLLAA